MKPEPHSPSAPTALQPLLTPSQIAAAWRLDVSTVRRLFQDEPGVLRLGRATARDGKRSYVTLRIPETVVQRVFQERTK